tara:strand:- start:113 stop:2599 length:2487 start_codon:yes stop_codon:yes gene_type:complete
MDPVKMISTQSFSVNGVSNVLSPNSKHSLTRTYSDTQFLMSDSKHFAQISVLKEHVRNYKQAQTEFQKTQALKYILLSSFELISTVTQVKNPIVAFDSMLESTIYEPALTSFVQDIDSKESISINVLLNCWNGFESSIKKLTLGQLYMNEYLKMERERIAHENDSDETYDVMDKITNSIQKNLETLILENLGQTGLDKLVEQKHYLQDANRNYNLQLDKFSQTVCFAKLSGTSLPKLPSQDNVLFPELFHLKLVDKIEFCLHTLDLEDTPIFDEFESIKSVSDTHEQQCNYLYFCESLVQKFEPVSINYPEGFDSFKPSKKIMFYVKHFMFESFISPFKAILALPLIELLNLVSSKKRKQNLDLYRSSQHYDNQFKNLNVLYSQEADPAVWSHPEVALTFLSRTIVDILLDSSQITRARLPETLCPFRTELMAMQHKTQRLLFSQVTWLTCQSFFVDKQKITFDSLYVSSQDLDLLPESFFSLVSFNVLPDKHTSIKQLLDNNLRSESVIFSLIFNRFKQFLNSAILEPYRYEKDQPVSPRKARTYQSASWLTQISKLASACMQISWHTYHNFYTKTHMFTMNDIIASMVFNPPEHLNWMSSQMKEELVVMKQCRERYIDIKVASVFTTAFLNEKAGIWKTIQLLDDDINSVSMALKSLNKTKEDIVAEFSKIVSDKIVDLDISVLETITEDDDKECVIPESLVLPSLVNTRLTTSSNTIIDATSLLPFLKEEQRDRNSLPNSCLVTTLISEFKTKLRKSLASKYARQSALRDLQATVLHLKSKTQHQAVVESNNIASTLKKIKIEFPLKPSLHILLRSSLGSLKTGI